MVEEAPLVAAVVASLGIVVELPDAPVVVAPPVVDATDPPVVLDAPIVVAS